MDAYILIHTEPGTAASACATIADIEGVEQVDQVYGQYDLVVRIFGDNLEEIPYPILRQIHRVPGVERTLTCPVLHMHRSTPVPVA